MSKAPDAGSRRQLPTASSCRHSGCGNRVAPQTTSREQVGLQATPGRLLGHQLLGQQDILKISLLDVNAKKKGKVRRTEGTERFKADYSHLKCSLLTFSVLLPSIGKTIDYDAPPSPQTTISLPYQVAWQSQRTEARTGRPRGPATATGPPDQQRSSYFKSNLITCGTPRVPTKNK